MSDTVDVADSSGRVAAVFDGGVPGILWVDYIDPLPDMLVLEIILPCEYS